MSTSTKSENEKSKIKVYFQGNASNEYLMIKFTKKNEVFLIFLNSQKHANQFVYNLPISLFVSNARLQIDSLKISLFNEYYQMC